MTHKKNKVGVASDKGMLRLALPTYLFDEKRYLYLGLEDTQRNRIIAEAKAKLIEYDLAMEKFDPTLEKYTSPMGKASKYDITLTEILTEYIEFKQLTVSESNHNYRTLKNWLNQMDDEMLGHPDEVTNFLLRNTSQEQARRLIQKITAGINWGVSLDKIDHNPFEAVPKLQMVSEPRVDPFSVYERDLIIRAFEDNHFHSLVQFLFFTGCRPSEAIGLKWEKINGDRTSILINEALVDRHLHPHTKNYKIRHFPINPQLREILDHIDQKADFIFLSKREQMVDFHNFTTRDWKWTMEDLAIRYRPPYCCRHTFITLCLQKHIPISQVAYWAGNSPGIILKHYAGIIPVDIPEL